MTGLTDSIDQIRRGLLGSPVVDRVEELSAGQARLQDDLRTSERQHAIHSDSREFEICAVSEAAARAVRNRLEIAARDSGVAIEWLERF